MALPPLASLDAFAALVGQEVYSDDSRAGAVLSAASTLVRTYTGSDWTDVAIPDAVESVTLQAAARVWANPLAANVAQVDDSTLRWSDVGLYLTETDREQLDAHRAPGTFSSPLGTLSMTGGSYGSDTIYVPTAPAPSGYPFPWYSAEDFS